VNNNNNNNNNKNVLRIVQKRSWSSHIGLIIELLGGPLARNNEAPYSLDICIYYIANRASKQDEPIPAL